MDEIMTVSAEAETQEMPALDVCVDCKRIIPPRREGEITGNYGLTAEGDKVCLDCCAYRDKGEMIETGRAVLYLTIDAGKWERSMYGSGRKYETRTGKITNWPGTLEFRGSVKRGRHNIASVRYDVWFRGPDGFFWHGVQYGDYTQLVHCKRTKVHASALVVGGKVIAKVYPTKEKEQAA